MVLATSDGLVLQLGLNFFGMEGSFGIKSLFVQWVNIGKALTLKIGGAVISRGLWMCPILRGWQLLPKLPLFKA